MVRLVLPIEPRGSGTARYVSGIEASDGGERAQHDDLPHQVREDDPEQPREPVGAWAHGLVFLLFVAPSWRSGR